MQNALVINEKDLTEDLISIAKLDHAGCTIIPTATALLRSAVLPDNDPQTWHLRLGERNLDNIRVAVKKI